jgi:hypothetical protein
MGAIRPSGGTRAKGQGTGTIGRGSGRVRTGAERGKSEAVRGIDAYLPPPTFAHHPQAHPHSLPTYSHPPTTAGGKTAKLLGLNG